MATVIRAICIDLVKARTTNNTQLAYDSNVEELDNLAKNYTYAPLDFIPVLAEAFNISVSCLNDEIGQICAQFTSDPQWTFNLILKPDSANGGRSAHYYVESSNLLSTFGDGNCLFNAFAQFLKLKFMREHHIKNDYYQSMIDCQPPVIVKPKFEQLIPKLSWFQKPSMNEVLYGLIAGTIIGAPLACAGMVALGLILMAVSLVIGVLVKLANLTNLVHDNKKTI
jgi:hypothetical protein